MTRLAYALLKVLVQKEDKYLLCSLVSTPSDKHHKGIYCVLNYCVYDSVQKTNPRRVKMITAIVQLR